VKRAALLFICLAMVCFIGGCQTQQRSFVKEDTQLFDTAHALVTALDNKDADAVVQLFSPFVRERAPYVAETIDELLMLYNGPTEEIGDFAWAATEEERWGTRQGSAHATIPVYAGGEYYWIYMKVTYKNTRDASMIGVTQLDVYTADAYYDYFWEEEARQADSFGLRIHQSDTKRPIVSVDGAPYCMEGTGTLDPLAVRAFFEGCDDWQDFQTRFGRPAAQKGDYVYKLPDENGQKRYLCLWHTDNRIVYAYIADAFTSVEYLLEASA